MSSLDQAQDVYSSTVHKAIIAINGGAYALLQVVTNQSWAPTKAAAHRSMTILSFLVLNLIYVILRVCEVKLQNKPLIRSFVGHTSHLFGALAAITLISLISTIFSLIVVVLWFVWLFVVIYIVFSESSNPHEANLTEASSQLPI